jgi:predicted PurR-regulated permease PerM
VLVYITLYQQFENIVLSPRITAKTMSLHPAVAFGAVIAGGAILGPIGALLALPAAASVQSLVSIYVRRYEVVASPLTAQQSPRKGEAASPLSAADSPTEQGLASTREEPSR